VGGHHRFGDWGLGDDVVGEFVLVATLRHRRRAGEVGVKVEVEVSGEVDVEVDEVGSEVGVGVSIEGAGVEGLDAEVGGEVTVEGFAGDVDVGVDWVGVAG